MSATDITRLGGEPVSRAPFEHWARVRRFALAAYLSALLLWSLQYGIPVQRELVILWTCGALVCVSVGRPAGRVLQIALDWLPIVVVLAAYDLTRGAADSFGIGVHSQPMIDFDRSVFFGVTPTEWLQERLIEPGVLNWWELGFSIVYTSYFIVPFAVAGLLWARGRLAFLQFRRRLVSLALAGVATYVAFPAAPPWMAAQAGELEGVDRTISHGFESLGVGTASLFSKGQSSVNLVAAVPSLHAAFTALVVMFLWSRVARQWRPLLALYPLAMALTLVATGEHYLFDILLGWLYAAIAMAGWSRCERGRGEAGASG